ncbi:MAG: helix-turn-helix domain-containing protein [Proteobacteria bacterium]|nr:helix-turn-helix domain-containing protein [Pseudomonadota bacterium]
MLSSRHLRTQAALAEKSGVAQSTIGRILRSQVTPQSDNLERLATAFGIPYSTFAALAEGGEWGDGAIETFQPAVTPRSVPLLSSKQAGRYAEGVYLDSLDSVIDWIELPKKRRGEHSFALRVSGESMEPDYQNGNIIYIDPDAAAIHGKDVIVRLGGERSEVVFRRLVVEGEHRYLKALNPNWPEKFVHVPADARIVGVVVGRYCDK